MSALFPADLIELLRPPDEMRSPVLELMLERVRSGSARGARTDGAVVALAIEGGGMRGAVSSGMCVVLEAAGLLPAVDRIYGVSAGALNGAATAAGQAALSATHYEDATARGVVKLQRTLRGGPAVDLDLLFGDVIGAHKPLSFDAFRAGPDFYALAVSADNGSPRVLSGFVDLDELMRAIRASASMPVATGRPTVFRGERLLDGGLLEPLPFARALADGATHVLVLRTRPASFRKPERRNLLERLVMRDSDVPRALVANQNRNYNRQCDELEQLCTEGRVTQIAPADGARLVRRLENSSAHVTDSLRVGAAAMAAAVLTEPIGLCWQPVAYRSRPAPIPERIASTSPAFDGGELVSRTAA